MWNKTNWFDVIGTDAIRQVVFAGSTAVGGIDCTSPMYIKVSIRVSVTFDDVPDGDTVINLYDVDRSGGADEPDTIPLFTQRISRQALTEKIITIPNLDVMSLDNIKVEVVNGNSIPTQSVWVWVSAMAANN